MSADVRHRKNFARKREQIRHNHINTRRCTIARHLAPLIAPATLLAGALHDPITALIAGALGVLLAVTVRAWLTEVIGRRRWWLRQDRQSRHATVLKLRTYRENVEREEQARQAKDARRRKHQRQMQKAAQKRYEARRATECRDKFQHATEESAVRHMETLTAREGKRLSVYQCEFCTHWHVGNSSRGVALVHRPFAKLKEVTS